MDQYPYKHDLFLENFRICLSLKTDSVLNAEDWKKRRKEILDSIIDLEYGGFLPSLRFSRLKLCIRESHCKL